MLVIIQTIWAVRSAEARIPIPKIIYKENE